MHENKSTTRRSLMRVKGALLLSLIFGIGSAAELFAEVAEDGSVRRVSSSVVRHVARIASPDKAGLPDVAIVASASSDVSDLWFTDPRDNLLASGLFASVSIIDAGQVTPSLVELQAYDAVLVWSNFSFADAETLGENLADYVDAGGGVVLAAFGNSSASDGRFLEGRWLSHDYHIIPSQGGTTTGSASLGTVHLPGHPLVAGVSSFDGGSASFRPTDDTVIASASVVAEWSDGRVLVAVREDTVGSRVDLGFYPPSDAVLSSFWDATTDGYTLMANALSYAATRPPLTLGDSDADADIDGDDFSNFEQCVTGDGNGPPLAGCVTFDFDDDGDVDCSDWTLMELTWTGPPALPILVDCNTNGIQDACDIAEGVSQDCTGNGLPDECEPDCNTTGIADSCDILDGTSDDCDGNLIPDECEAPQADCNSNGIADGCDLTSGFSLDCNNSGVPDACDISMGTSFDTNGDGIPDECCAIAAQPVQTEIPMTPMRQEVLLQNRYLSFSAGETGFSQAIRVTFFSLAPPFDEWNGVSMWVGPTRQVSDIPGVSVDMPPNVTMATLQCDPFFTDWSTIGELSVYHPGIIPGSEYRLQAVSELCPLSAEEFYSIPFVVQSSLHGDVVGQYNSQLQMWTAPDDSVGVPTDVVAALDKFQGLALAPTKSRVDVYPATPDQIISISDVTAILGAFVGETFSFTPGPLPCGE